MATPDSRQHVHPSNPLEPRRLSLAQILPAGPVAATRLGEIAQVHVLIRKRIETVFGDEVSFPPNPNAMACKSGIHELWRDFG